MAGPAHLSAQECLALGEFVARARALCGENLVEMKLYGSRARSEGHLESDLDIFVLLKNCDRATDRALNDLAADLLVETGILLDPRMWGQAQWNTWVRHERLYAQEVQRDGVPL